MVRVSTRTTKWILRLGIVAVGAAEAWADRYGVTPDGVSYLNLSDGWASGAWSAGINAYWSPAYPALLGFARALVRPSLANEATLLHAVNLITMVLSLVGFEMFLSEIRARGKPVREASGQNEPSDEPLWWLFLAYGLFAWGALELIGVGLSSPDMLGAAALYFAAAMTLRSMRAPSAGIFAALGFALGFGYLARAALLVIGALWAAVVAAGFGVPAPFRWRVGTLIVFFVVAMPLIAALSFRSGHLTFGDTARVNQGWHVNKYPFIWTGLPEGSGTPVHAPVVVNEHPRIVAYPGSAGASYPYFDDPSYWTEGMTPRPNLAGQARTTRKQLFAYNRFLGPLVLGLFALSLLAKPRTVVLRDLAARGVLTIPLFVLLAGYAAIVTQARFFAAPAVILSLLGFNALRRARSPPPIRVLVGSAAVITLWNLADRAPDIAHQSLLVARELSGTRIPHDHYLVASALAQAGLRRGDKVGVIGDAMGSYWARLAGVRIAVEVPKGELNTYWAASDSARAEFEAKLWGAGARAIVTTASAAVDGKAGWQALPAPRYFVKWAPLEPIAAGKRAQRSAPVLP
jgi:hypothetical protein